MLPGPESTSDDVQSGCDRARDNSVDTDGIRLRHVALAVICDEARIGKRTGARFRDLN
jgi:hypothetical protein